eukprot:CAMPEP_0198133112 /NCGR_PEP_ID=MMETSP1442-20131203/59397_1 /TAXON_ID= /ORGANISM="Craspedostauros australis, Strain CCMP3328" /LENGTH=302 /DNA_ID=CAMNT_0043794217 /DNA_START=133 /DNA_END=1041 /DNA_ORIENTATION=+
MINDTNNMTSAMSASMPSTPIAPTRKRSVQTLDRERRCRREESIFRLAKRCRTDSIHHDDHHDGDSREDDTIIPLHPMSPLAMASMGTSIPSLPSSSSYTLPIIDDDDEDDNNNDTDKDDSACASSSQRFNTQTLHFLPRMRPRLLSFDSEEQYPRSPSSSMDDSPMTPAPLQRVAEQRDDVNSTENNNEYNACKYDSPIVSMSMASVMQLRPQRWTSLSMEESAASPLSARGPLPVLPSLDQLDATSASNDAEEDSTSGFSCMLTTLRPRFGQSSGVESTGLFIPNSISFDEEDSNSVYQQ